MLITLIIGILFSLFIWFFSFKINELLNTQIGPTLRVIAPLCIVLPFQFFISAVSTGTNKIKIEAIFNIIPKIIFLIALIVFIAQYELSVLMCIVLNLISSLAVILIVLIGLKPRFNELKKHLKLVLSKNKKYGIHYYAGSVFNQTTYRLDEIFISGFINTVQLGYYSLANLVCSPMIMMSQSLSRSMFKRYANSDRIPKQVFSYNTAWLFLCVIGLFAISKIFVGIIFENYDFSSVLKYIFPLSFAFFFQGLCAPYVFLAAKSMGKEIRNVAWMEAIINIAGNLILIPIYGVLGAIYASILAKLVHFLALKFYYYKYLKQKGLA